MNTLTPAADAATPDFLSESELRAYLKLESARKRSTWFRVRPFFAPALVTLPTGSSRGHRLYETAKVRALLAGRLEARTPLARVKSLRKVG
jgi:hypothetical protein